jgi:hypothetical protein
LLRSAVEEHAMAKRRMRRMTAMNEDQTGQPNARRSTADSLGDTARDLSVSAVRSMTEAAKAALSGMQEIGRTMADMAAPAARRTVKTANEVTRAAMDSTRELTRTAGDMAGEATRSASDGTRRGGAGRPAHDALGESPRQVPPPARGVATSGRGREWSP